MHCCEDQQDLYYLCLGLEMVRCFYQHICDIVLKLSVK